MKRDKKQIILKFLKVNGRSSTTRIAAKMRSDIWMARQYLDQLEQDKKIKKEVETNSTFWSLKNE